MLTASALARAQFAPSRGFHLVYVTPDRFFTVVSDTEYSSNDAALLCQRLRSAWTFDTQRNGLTQSPALDMPIQIRVTIQLPRNIFGYAAGTGVVLISRTNLNTPHAMTTFSHELTHVQDFRLLRGRAIPSYLLEGRAVDNAIYFRLPLGYFPDFKDEEVRKTLAACTSSDVRAVLSLAPGVRAPRELQFKVESIGCFMLEYLRLYGNRGAGFADIQARSTRLIEDVANGTPYAAAFQTAFGVSLPEFTTELCTWFDVTQGVPDQRLKDTPFQNLSAPVR